MATHTVPDGKIGFNIVKHLAASLFSVRLDIVSSVINDNALF